MRPLASLLDIVVREARDEATSSSAAFARYGSHCPPSGFEWEPVSKASIGDGCQRLAGPVPRSSQSFDSCVGTKDFYINPPDG